MANHYYDTLNRSIEEVWVVSSQMYEKIDEGEDLDVFEPELLAAVCSEYLAALEQSKKQAALDLEAADAIEHLRRHQDLLSAEAAVGAIRDASRGWCIDWLAENVPTMYPRDRDRIRQGREPLSLEDARMSVIAYMRS